GELTGLEGGRPAVVQGHAFVVGLEPGIGIRCLDLVEGVQEPPWKSRTQANPWSNCSYAADQAMNCGLPGATRCSRCAGQMVGAERHRRWRQRRLHSVVERHGVAV